MARHASIQPAQIEFNATGTPVSTAFDDIYFSPEDGLAESQYVFIEGNQLTQRFSAWSYPHPFVVGETGFGSGLNMLLAATCFLHHAPADARLHLISFEKYPLQAEQLRQALQHWPQLAQLSEQLFNSYPPLVAGCHRLYLHPRITLDLHFADVLEALPDWQQSNPHQVHAWFLDGFAPAKNPDMWQDSLYRAMAHASAPTATVATFTSVGAIRRGLIQAGFAMRKQKGFGHKRDMLVGQHIRPALPATKGPQHVIIIGAGIAGACTALQLKLRRPQLQITVLEAATQSASAASGNPQGAVYPLLQADPTIATELYRSAFVYARQFYQRWSADTAHWCGVLQLAFSAQMNKRQQHIVQRTAYPTDWLRPVSASEASQLSGLTLDTGGLWYADGGWVEPAPTVKRLLDTSGARVVTDCDVSSVTRATDKSQWRVISSQGDFAADTVVFAAGAHLQSFDNENNFDIRPVAGQVSRISDSSLNTQRCVICHKGYLTPAHQPNNTHCAGATFDKLGHIENAELNPTDSAHEANLALQREYLKLPFAPSVIVDGRVSVRATTADHLPLAGPFGEENNGLWVIGGLGSRGLTSAPWCTGLLADAILGEVCASGQRIRQSVDSRRFIWRRQRRLR